MKCVVFKVNGYYDSVSELGVMLLVLNGYDVFGLVVDVFDEDVQVVQVLCGVIDEVEFGNVLQVYLCDICCMLLLMLQQEFDIVQVVCVGDFDVCQVMIEYNLRFVVSIVKNYFGCGLLMSDLIEEGNFGLMYVISKFEFEWGFCFFMYLSWWICQSIEWVLMYQVCFV